MSRYQPEFKTTGIDPADKQVNNGKGASHGPLVPSGTLSDGTGRDGATPQAQEPIPASVDSPELGGNPDAIERDCQLLHLPDVHAPLVHREYTCLNPTIGATFH